MIDVDNCMKIVSKLVIEIFKHEPHLQPYVTWVNKNSYSITQNGPILIQFSSYHDRIWCDVLSMNIVHSLLDRPWYYDLDVKNAEKLDTCTFWF